MKISVRGQQAKFVIYTKKRYKYSVFIPLQFCNVKVAKDSYFLANNTALIAQTSVIGDATYR
jgi:hypothetical protein